MSVLTASTPATLAACGLTALLVVAVVTDLRSRRIPNWLVVVGFVLAGTTQAFAAAQGVPGLAGTRLWAPLAGALIGAAALLPLYALRGCAAGDMKLLAMVGAFVGPALVLVVALGTLVAGGLLALAFMLGRGVAAQTLRNLRRIAARAWARAAGGPGAAWPAPMRHTAARLPYAVAITMGTLAALVFVARLH